MTDAPLTPDQAAMLADAIDLERYGVVAVENGTMTRVHDEEVCARRGGACWIHRPTQDWPLAGRPIVYDARRALAWRRCEHDVLHPDIDSVAWLERGKTKHEDRGIRPGDASWHPDCDGCCMAPIESLGLSEEQLARVHRTAEGIARDMALSDQALSGQAYQHLLRNFAAYFMHPKEDQ